MKLLRYRAPGNIVRPAMLDSAGTLRDIGALVPDVDLTLLTPAVMQALRDADPAGLPSVEGQPCIAPCVANVRKIVAVGLNYRDHAEETKLALPSEPVLFLKPSSSICGPDDDVEMPRGAQKMDWEVELGVVIGTRAKYVDEVDAMRHVAGYCIVNDVSERAFQMERPGGQWDKGKGHDTFAPLGPWFVTADEVPDPQALAIWLEVNGERMQDGTTANMVFGVRALVAYISRFMTLEPGDVIATGTPAGVGLGRKPPRFLRAGDVMRLGIDGLGEQRQACVAL